MWKFGGAAKSPTSRKNVVLKNSEPFMNSFTKTSSNGDSFSLESSSSGDNSNDNSNEAVSEPFIPLFFAFGFYLVD